MQRVVAKCVDAQVNLEAYDKNRKAIYEGLTKLGFECVKPEGAFYLFVKSPVEDETVAPQGTHVTSKQTVTHEYLRKH